MKIYKDLTTQKFKDEFQALFPHLKVEFYTKSHKHFQASSDREIIAENRNLGSLNSDLIESVIDIPESMLVDEFETQMAEKFNLYIQVFRKSGDQWLQTSITDNWSLGKQEAKAANLDEFIASHSDE